MYRRRFLALCAAGSGALAGCPERSQDAGSTASPGGTTDEAPTPTEESTPTATPVPPLDGSWRSYQRDMGNTGGTADSGPTADPVERWRRGTTTGQPVSLASADGVFVVLATRRRRQDGPGESDGVLYARNAADGSIRWIGDQTVDTRVGPLVAEETAVVFDGDALVGLGIDTGDARWSLPLERRPLGLATAGGRVVVATATGVLTVSPTDGSQQWRQQTEGEIVTPPGAGDGTVAVGLASGAVLALEADTGRERWRVSLEVESAFQPAVGSGSVYVAADSRLVALDGEDGSQQWGQGTDDPLAAPPVATADAVYVVTLDDDAEGQVATPASGEETPTPTATDVRWFAGTVTAVSSADGDVRWRATRTEQYSFTSGPPEKLALTAAGELILIDLDGTLVAYNSGGEEAWAANAGSVRPAIADGVVSTGTVGIDSATGSRRWRLRVGDSITSGPAVVDNTLYVGSDDNYLYALAANSGRIEWTARTDDIIRATPVVGEDAVYVGTINGTLYAVDRADGAELWSVTVGSVVRSPALQDGTLYLGNFSETVRAIDAADGSVRWQTAVESDRFVALEVAVGDGAVYAGSNGDLRAFETGDGAERWAVRVGNRSRVQSSPVAANGRVYVNIGEAVRAYDTADGSLDWSAPIAGNANKPPVVYDGVVYTSSDGAVHAFDAADGAERWQRSVGDTLTMVATDDAMYAWGHDTPLVALDPADGSNLWRLPSLEPSSPLAVADGYLFFGDHTGSVRALGTPQ